MAVVSLALVSCIFYLNLFQYTEAVAANSFPYYRTTVLVKRSPGGISGGNWRLPFSRPAFLSALTDNSRDGGDQKATVSDSELLPDYLLHQEFIKPQLQAAGFSGGKIIAGPFPVPLSSLPRPPSQSGTQPGKQFAQSAFAQQQPVEFIQPPPVKNAAIKQQSYKLVQQSLPAHHAQYSTQVAQFPYAPVQAVKTNAQPALRQTPIKLAVPSQSVAYVNIKPSLPVHYSAVPTHSGGYHLGGTIVNQQPFSLYKPNGNPSIRQEVKLSYGGWTPIYSASVKDETDNKQEQGNGETVTQRTVLAQNEASQALDDSDLQNIDFGNVFGDFGPLAQASESSQSISDSVPALETNGDNLASRVDSEPEKVEQPTANSERPVSQDKRKAKQDSSFTRSKYPNEEVVVVTATNVDSSGLGRGQGRYVGRVLPASVFDDDVTVGKSRSSKHWKHMSDNLADPVSLSPVGYTLHFTERR